MWIDSTSWHKLIVSSFNYQMKVNKMFILLLKRSKIIAFGCKYFEMNIFVWVFSNKIVTV